MHEVDTISKCLGRGFLKSDVSLRRFYEARGEGREPGMCPRSAENEADLNEARHDGHGGTKAPEDLLRRVGL